MSHPLYDVTDFEIVGDYTLRVTFDDKTEQIINFEPVLAGYYYSPLRDLKLFNQVRLDGEIRNLVWPNGADFDPANLHDWPKVAQEFAQWAASLQQVNVYNSPKELTLAMA